MSRNSTMADVLFNVIGGGLQLQGVYQVFKNGQDVMIPEIVMLKL